MDFCLCGAILNWKAFCFGAIPDIVMELVVYGSVPQSRQACMPDCLCRPTGSSFFRAQVRGLIILLAQGLICPKSGTGYNEP